VQNIQEVCDTIDKGLDRINEAKADPAAVEKAVHALKAQIDGIVKQANLAAKTQ
jgi:hypothetical protein